MDWRFSEDKETWDRECDRCNHDPGEDEETQMEMVTNHRGRGDARVGMGRGSVDITVDLVLGGVDLETRPRCHKSCRSIQCTRLPTVFGKRFKGSCRSPPAWNLLRLLFLRAFDAKPKNICWLIDGRREQELSGCLC